MQIKFLSTLILVNSNTLENGVTDIGHYMQCPYFLQIYLHRFAKVASLAHEATFVAL